MKFAQLILPLALLGLFSLELSQAQFNTTLAPDAYPDSQYLSSPDASSSLSSPDSSYADYSDYGGTPKRFYGNMRYTAVRRIRKSNVAGGTGTGTGAANRRGNRNANRNRNRRGNRNANRNRNRRGKGNHNKKRQAAKGRRSNGMRRMNNRRGASVIRVG